MISKDDFMKDETIKVLDYWLCENEDWEEEFESIDLTNKKGEGNVLFRVIIIMECFILLLNSIFRSSLTGPSTRILTSRVTWGLTWNERKIYLEIQNDTVKIMYKAICQGSIVT